MIVSSANQPETHELTQNTVSKNQESEKAEKGTFETASQMITTSLCLAIFCTRKFYWQIDLKREIIQFCLDIGTQTTSTEMFW